MYMKKYDLGGRVAVVTGGGRGIGLACARALAEAGASVVIADIDSEVGAAGQKALAETGFDVDLAELDVRSPEQVTATVDRLEKKHGSVDIVVCSAGIAPTNTPAETVTDERWLEVMNVNLNGVFWCCREFGKKMLERGKGAIVNIGSMSGVISNKPQEQCYYNASKAGVHHLTKSLAGEWASRGVRVNAVAPTYIETDLTRDLMDDQSMYPMWMESTPMHRMGQPEEIASVVLFLASDASSLLTGSVILADGGYTCW